MPSRSAADQTLLIWGSGEHGQHGYGHSKVVSVQDGKTNQKLQQVVASEGGVKCFACGSSHSVLVTNIDNIYVWGNGQNGQLGCGDPDNRLEPTRIELYPLQESNPDVAGVACGGRQTFVWLTNGYTFSFGNNFYAQLGYDFRIKNYKDNQLRPHLLRTLMHRPVEHVACGNRHTLMLFTNKQIAIVGNGSYGQIGDGGRMEAVVPKIVEDFPKVEFVACGTFHNLIIDEYGVVWTWGYGPACGSRSGDVLLPTKVDLRHQNAVKVAGGLEHSAALTKNGNIYTWGKGQSGELGHGPDVRFLSRPRRLRCPELRNQTADFGAVEGYTAAVTSLGAVFMWGKNSHVIYSDKAASEKIWQPCMTIPTNENNGISKVFLGAWHIAAVTGKCEWTKHDDLSDADDDEDIVVEATPSPEVLRGPELQREGTALTIAEFYAESSTDRLSPTDDLEDDINCKGQKTSSQHEHPSEEDLAKSEDNRDKRGSASSQATAVQQQNTNNQPTDEEKLVQKPVVSHEEPLHDSKHSSLRMEDDCLPASHDRVLTSNIQPEENDIDRPMITIRRETTLPVPTAGKRKKVKKRPSFLRETTDISVPRHRSKSLVPLKTNTTELHLATVQPIGNRQKTFSVATTLASASDKLDIYEQTHVWQLQNRLTTSSYSDLTYAKPKTKYGSSMNKLPRTDAKYSKWQYSRSKTDMTGLSGNYVQKHSNNLWSYDRKDADEPLHLTAIPVQNHQLPSQVKPKLVSRAPNRALQRNTAVFPNKRMKSTAVNQADAKAVPTTYNQMKRLSLQSVPVHGISTGAGPSHT